MYCAYQDREELEDDLYQEDEGDSEGSEVNSELEFHLYSQLHYSSNAGDMEEQEDRGEKVDGQDSQQLKLSEKPGDVDGEQEQAGESRPPSPDVNKLLQQLKEKQKKKGEKKKKGSSNTKGPKSSSSYFEEVIVIDSSPDVISISEDDTADDDDAEGICALKGRSLNRLQTSTPAQQRTQKSVSVPVTVDSSSSESDSEESESDSSDSSDSEDLENWMILGRGNQDGDHSISLNLEGGSDSNEDAAEDGNSWLVSAKDKEAQIYNKDKSSRITPQRVPHRYYTGKNIQCRNCNKTGHLSKNCPEPRKLSPCFLCGTPGHLVSYCPNRYCNNCGLPGHLYNSCRERAYWHQRCERCSMTGHLCDACPEIWRQYHLTTKKGTPNPVKQQREDRGRTPAYCYNCSRDGHFGHACTQRRMFNGTYPSTPFINHYDTRKEIMRRERWMKLKVKELKTNGLFPTSNKAPLTPGPPKKKQKISHHKSNHQFNHTSRQSPHNHRTNHIFFNNNDDFGAIAPQRNKYNKHKQGTSNVKPWKPKRPVPTSREPRPPTKVIVDEAEDFPRGGGKGEDPEKKKKKRKRTRKREKVPSALPEGHRKSRPDHLFGTVPGEMQGSASQLQKRKKNRRSRGLKNAHKNDAAHMYPTDENLFIIKQRKRSR